MAIAKGLAFLLLLCLSGCAMIQPVALSEQPAQTEVEQTTMSDRVDPQTQDFDGRVPRLEEADELAWSYETIDLNGTTIEYATLLPPNFDPAGEYPLLLALPPGGQDKNMVNAGIDTFWQRGALYGFVIVSPVKPSGTSYMRDGSLILPEFVAFLHETYTIAGGKPHLGGVSNGGISTFKAGLEHPELYRSLTVLPGYAAADSNLSTLSELKVTLYVGEHDGRWVTSSQRTYDALVAANHNDPLLEIFPNEGHVIQSLTGNGVGQIFERLLQE
ncbi:MAG: hypothetical protein AAF702_09545 [Chloroflexota bacterium]